MPVVGAKERLDRAVAGLEPALEHERGERHALDEFGAQLFRQRGHLLVGAGAGAGALPHLAGAVGGLTELGQRLLEEFAVH